jgi:hypothetical protein
LINTIEKQPSGYPSFINQYATYGWDFIEMKLLEYLNIKHSSVYTRSSIAVEDKKKSKNYPAVLGYIPKPYHALYQLITSKD